MKIFENNKFNFDFFSNFAELLPDIIQNNCSKCDETQRRNSMQVINHVRTHRPQEWQRLLAQYDPQGIHMRRLAGAF